MLTEQEKQIIEAGKTAGKSKQEIVGALAKYRGQNGVAPTPPKSEEVRKGFLKETGEDFLKIGEDALDEFGQAGKNINKINQDSVGKSKGQQLQSVLDMGAEAYRRGGRFLAKTLLGLGKLVLPQGAEDKVKEIGVGLGKEIAIHNDKFMKDLRLSAETDPDDKRILEMIEGFATKYKQDPEFKKNIDNAGGFAEGVADLVGGGAAGKGANVIVDSASNVRKLAAEIDIPYFQDSEKIIADAVTRMKNSIPEKDIEGKVPETPEMKAAAEATAKAEATASAEAINNFRQEIVNQVTVNVANKTEVGEITARLDTLIKQGEFEKAAAEASKVIKDKEAAESLTQKAIDAALIGGQKVVQQYTEMKEGATRRISENFDRQALQENASIPIEQVDANIGKMYTNAVSQGVKGKKQTQNALTDNVKSAVEAVKDITLSKDDLKFRDLETNDVLEGQLPTNLWEFGGAITSQKSKVWGDILEKIKATGEKPIDSTRISDAMDEIIENPVYAGETSILNRAQQAKEKFDLNEYSPAQIEELIQLENDRLQAFYRGAGTQGDAVVSAIVVNNLRDILDEAVESATGEGIRELKKRYGNLKAIERDVVHRALHNDQARKAGMVDMFGIRSIGDLASAGMGDLSALKRGAAQIAGESFIKALNDRDSMIKRMFLVAGERYTPSSLTQ